MAFLKMLLDREEDIEGCGEALVLLSMVMRMSEQETKRNKERKERGKAANWDFRETILVNQL